jgi:transcription antitermination factor NusG
VNGQLTLWINKRLDPQPEATQTEPVPPIWTRAPCECYSDSGEIHLQTEPWQVDGVSRATWYRRSRPEPEPEPVIIRPDLDCWYCARTYYARDQDAEAEIWAAGFDVFAPTIHRSATRARRNAVGAIIPAHPAGFAPLFGGYLFARFRLTDYWRARSDLPSVDSILGLTHNAPTPMPDRAMELIRGMCDADGCYHEHGDIPNSLVGSLVRLTAGPMSSFEGMCEWSSGHRVRVLLSLFGRDCPITVDQTAVEVA